MLKKNYKKTNAKESQESFNQHKSAHVVILKLILNCRKCSKEFFSNNKFYKHLKICNRIKTNKLHLNQIQDLAVAYIITVIFVVMSINKAKNYHDFVFRAHRYAIAKKSLIL